MTGEEAVFGAVDWGGTWIRAALVAGDTVLHRERMYRAAALPEQYEQILDLVRRCIAAVGRQPVAVGLGVAGIVQREAVMTAVNIGITSATEVALGLAALGRPVFVLNDAHAAAIGLAARWPDELTAVLTMGTGIGGAVIDRGRLLAGNGAAGDFGHIVVDPYGPQCPCGGAGCLEMMVSGKVLAAAAEALAVTGRSPYLAGLRESGERLHGGHLQEAAAAGDALAEAALKRAATVLVAGVRSIVAALDPARIVVSGALLADGAPFGTLVARRWTDLRPAWCATPLIHMNGDEDAALRGAARFAATRLASDASS